MAIYHFSATILSRSHGRSVVACAAYRSAKRLQDERYGQIHDYTRKQDVAHAEILLPTFAPEWMGDRAKLWNGVEASEKRKDAQLAREFNFALPRELTLEQNINLARAFVQKEFVEKGMVADLCIHNDKMPSGERQPHAHVMLTFREVSKQGFGKKVRAWNAKAYVCHWRQAWAETVNRVLALHGHDIRIDHRSFEAQGIKLEPQYKIGPALAKARLSRMEDHHRIARENGDKILRNPTIALHAITCQQSTFIHLDLARFINRQTQDAAQFKAVYEAVKGSPELVYLGRDSQGRERFTTSEMLSLETQMLERALKLAKRYKHPVSDVFKKEELKQNLSVEQQNALEHLLCEGDLKNIVGFAGTGKSYLLSAARKVWEAQGYQVQGITLSGIAAENLEMSSGIVSSTLASRFYHWDQKEQTPTPKTILVVDEAGMIGSSQLNRLLETVEHHQSKMVLIGDPYQLQAIEAGAAFRAVIEVSPTVALTDIRRQQTPWQKEATVALAIGKTLDALECYNQHHSMHGFKTHHDAKMELIKTWDSTRLNTPDKTQIILAYTREEVRGLNELARHLRRIQGELGEDHKIQTEQGARYFAEGDRIYFLENDTVLKVRNGTLGTLEHIERGRMVVRLDNKNDGVAETRRIRFSEERYNQLAHGYAATIHKAQGVTVDRTYLLASQYMDAHATYVALSRHRESAEVFYSMEVFAKESVLFSTLSRVREKDISLDYKPHDFGRHRGFENVSAQDNSDLTTQVEDPLKISKTSLSNRALLDEFQRQFSMQYPEEAKAVYERFLPHQERLAIKVEGEIKALEKHAHISQMARGQLETYAKGLAKKPEVMRYLRMYHPDLYTKIDALSKSHALREEINRGRRR